MAFDGWTNYGDVSPEHGQTWLKYGGPDYYQIVEVIDGESIEESGFVLVSTGSICIPGENAKRMAALECCGDADKIGPPEYTALAYAMHAYWGFDLDTWGHGTLHAITPDIESEIQEYLK